MSMHASPTPWLTVVDGTMSGRSFAIPPGRTEIGRQAGVAILLDADNVSRRHATVERAGRRVVLTDLGSTNGTWINRRRLQGPGELHDGDVVRVGSVSLRFSTATPGPATAVLAPQPAAERGGAGARYGFGDVRGPVQTGDGRQYTAGRDQYNAEGDQYFDDRVSVSLDYDPSDELFQGKGFGRVLLALGSCVALVGFGMWMYVIFSAFGADPGEVTSPFDLELVPGVPMAVAGFALFVVGGVLAGVGSGMSKAARKREEQQQRFQARRRRQRM